MQVKYKYLYIVSVLLIISGAALALTEHRLFDVLYGLGAVGYGLYYVLAPERDASRLLRRVARIGSLLWTALPALGSSALRSL